MIEKNKCCGCGVCSFSCKFGAITMEKDKEGFLYPQINEEKCVQCGQCDFVCPNVRVINYEFEHKVYGIKARTDEIRMNSSSGGAFYLLAKSFLENGGVVYGVGFTEGYHVCHLRVDNVDDIHLIQKSKYVQSDMINVIQQFIMDMNDQRHVLFSGTPCQIAAIKSLTRGMNEKNLFCVDLLCHGVPSPGWWEEYINGLEKKGDIEEIDFRKKTEDILWGDYVFEYKKTGGNAVELSYDEFVYGKAFLSNMSLRESCYSCNMKGLNSKADITLGDFWKIQSFRPDFYSKKGVSAVVINSEKGIDLFDGIINQADVYESNMAELEKDSSLFVSQRKPMWRDAFMKSDKSIDSLNKYLHFEKRLISIGIWGSYNTRVIVNETHNNLKWHFGYSSLISVMGKECSGYELSDDNNFRLQMRKKDANKFFVKNAKHLMEEIDYFVIDLLEERLMVKTDKQGDVTLLSDYSIMNNKAGCYSELFEIWKKRADDFISLITTYIDVNKIIFISHSLTKGYGTNGVSYEWENVAEIVALNKYLKQCNDYFISKAKVTKVIEVPAETCFTQKYHRFGKYPFHLNYMAYQRCADQLENYMRDYNV